MRLRITTYLTVAVLLAFSSVNAQTIATGSSRQDVVSQFGEPLGTVRYGTDEVLTYRDVEVQLRDGRVVKLIRLNDRPLPNPKPSTPTNAAAAAVASNRVATAPAVVPDVKGAFTKSGWTPSKINGLFLILVGTALSLWGGIWLLIRAFRVHVGWGLACLFLPLVQLIFVCVHWGEGGKPFLLSIAGGATVGLGFYVAFM